MKLAEDNLMTAETQIGDESVRPFVAFRVNLHDAEWFVLFNGYRQADGCR